MVMRAGGGHHGVEVARGAAVDEVALRVAAPGFDEGEVGFEGGLEEVRFAVEVAGLLAVGDDGADAGGGVEGGDACAAGADALGEGALRDEVDFEFAGDDLLLEQLVFADVASGVGGDQAGFEHEAHAESVDAHVVGDGVEAGDAAADESGDAVFGNAAEAEAAEHEGGAVGDVVEGRVGGGEDFVHAVARVSGGGDEGQGDVGGVVTLQRWMASYSGENFEVRVYAERVAECGFCCGDEFDGVCGMQCGCGEWAAAGGEGG